MKSVVYCIILFNCFLSNYTIAQDEKSAFLQKVDKYGADRSLSNEDKILFLDSVIQVSSENSQFEPLAYSFYHKSFTLFALQADLDSVFNTFLQCIHAAKKAQDYDLLSNSYAKIAQFLAMIEKNDEALIYCDSSIIASQKINYLYGSYSAFLTKSRIELVAGNLDNALAETYNAEKYAANAHDSIGITKRIASIYKYKGDLETSETLHHEVINFYGAQKTKPDSVYALQWTANLASLYDELNLQNKRKEILSKALYLSGFLDKPYLRANVLKQHADYHLSVTNDLDSAQYYLSILDAELPEIKERDFEADVNQTKGDLYMAMHQYDKAISFYNKSYRHNKEVKYLEKLKHITFRLSALNDSVKNHELALKYYKEYVVTRDSIQNIDEIEKFKEIELTNQFDKEKLANDLVYQKEITEEKEAKLYLIGGLSVLGLLILFVLYAYRMQRKQSKVLDEKNSVIEKSLDEKQLLLKEIHHRVKNNFQIVSSLLELQTRGIEDEKAKELALEGQNRVKSMALIHQKLYQNDYLTVNVLDYLEQLVREMTNMFATSEIKSKVEANQDVFFDVDTLIPLGLIINELLTNSFKYGLKGKEENSLMVKLEKVSDEFYELTVKDSGEGISDEIPFEKRKSLGLRLIKRLSKQLHGNVVYSFENGAQFKVRFKDQEMRLNVD